MAASSSCTDDGGGIFYDDTQFKGRADPPPCSMSTIRLGERFACKIRSHPLEWYLNTRKRTVKRELCKNCGAECRDLVFNHGCTVECALGYFQRRKNIDGFSLVSAAYRRVPAYRELQAIPVPTVYKSSDWRSSYEFIENNKKTLYHRDDARYHAYRKQLEINEVASQSSTKERDVIQRL